MQNFILKLLFLLCTIGALQNTNAAQTDSWVNDSQVYYKIMSSVTGIVRVPTLALTQAGIPISAFAPQNIQIFFRGNEIPIYIRGEEQGIIEYIEFTSQRNDGWLDTGLYVSPLEQSNTLYSMFNDSSAYFFTWNSSFNNLRYQTPPAINGEIEDIQTGTSQAVFFSPNKLYYNEFGPEFSQTEGWFSQPEITMGNTVSKTIQLKSKAPAGTIHGYFAVASVNDVASQSGYNHHLQIKVGNSILLDTLFLGYKAIKKDFTIDAASVGSSITMQFSSINDLNLSSDRMAISEIKLSYPATFTIDNSSQASYNLEPSTSNRRITISGLSANESPYIYETQNAWRFSPAYTNGNWVIIVPPSDSNLKLNITANPSLVASSQIRSAPMQIDILETDFIIVSHTSLMSSAQEYATYRKGFVADIERLYNRYAYGINGHPLAIRYFLRNYADNGYRLPSYLLLLGKGISQETIRKTPSLAPQNLIPVLGAPPSDMMLTVRILETSGIPEVMVGRVAAKTNSDVLAYLNKVKEQEQRTPTLGAKNVLFFGGGSNATEQSTFATYLRGYEEILSGTHLGGYPSTFLKNSSAPIVTSQSDSIRQIIEQGPLVLTFFGHSWSGGFDQNIDDPETFNNQGKYPLIIANSCYSGNIFESGSSTISERWVLIPNQGSIAFLASTHLGYPSFLNLYTQEFFKNIASESYYQSMGKSIMNAIEHLISTQTSVYTKSTCLEFLYHGDPAVKPIVGRYSDLLIDATSLKLIPHNITTSIDSFAVQIAISNPGKALTTPTEIYAERLLPNGTTQTKIVTLEKLLYRDTVEIYFTVDHLNGAGENRIQVMVDYLNEINELSESNNSQVLSFNIASNEIFPIYPHPFSVQNQSNVTLKASTGNPFEQQQSYIFQLDTSPNFNSPNSQTELITSNGGVIEWEPKAELQLNTSYFWRVAKESNSEPEKRWQETSFSVSNQTAEWGQISEGQVYKNDFRFIELTENGINYTITPREISCTNYGLYSGNAINQINYDIDGNGDYGSCGSQPSIVIAVIDSLTLLPWKADRGEYGHADYPICYPRTNPNRYFTFPANAEGRNNMNIFLRNVVENGNYILAYSVTNAQFETWSNQDYESFEMLGSTQIRTVPNNYPYIFIGKKGFPEFAEEVVGETATDAISLRKTLTSNFHYGSIITPWIGPANQWKTIYWNSKTSEFNDGDSVNMKVYVRSSTEEDSIVAILSSKDTVASLDFLNNMNADHIKLEYFTYDINERSPLPIQSIAVDFVPFPELALNPNAGHNFHASEIMEGDTLIMATAVTNVSEVKAERIPITYSYQSLGNNEIEEKVVIIDSLLPLQSIIDTVKFATYGKSGTQQVLMKINYPDSEVENFPEYHVFNNLGWKASTVTPDDRQPILSVLFDGRHIMNNEIISSQPEILVRLNDQNPFIPLNDTSAFEMYLTSPYTDIPMRIWLQPEITAGRLFWQPATTQANECSLRWNPEFDTDGIYELNILAKDLSGNTSGDNGYRIRFEIVNRSTITHLLNYPNPFTTSTRFAFTLTGSKIPDELRIQIYTVTGRVVREIEMTELGPLQIGHNLTKFAWDGTDQFGNRLANGVYFYRVITKIDGSTIEHRATSADKYFTKNFGTMYLMK